MIVSSVGPSRIHNVRACAVRILYTSSGDALQIHGNVLWRMQSRTVSFRIIYSIPISNECEWPLHTHTHWLLQVYAVVLTARSLAPQCARHDGLLKMFMLVWIRTNEHHQSCLMTHKQAQICADIDFEFIYINSLAFWIQLLEKCVYNEPDDTNYDQYRLWMNDFAKYCITRYEAQHYR